MKQFWQKWWALLPAVLVAAAVAVSLALTEPTLAEVPALLTPAPAAAQAAPAADTLKAETGDAGELPYDDGVYEGTAAGYGGEITVRVTMDGGSIYAIDVVSAEEETEAFFKRARAVIPEMIEQNTWEVDTVSGATYSSTGLKNAVENALTGKSQTRKKTAKGGSLPYADGVYEGTAAGFGGDITVNVTVESGAITAVDLADAKKETLSFLKKARAVLTDIVESNTWEVDTVTGATYSSRGIINAVKNALTGAASSANVRQGALSLDDGEYLGTGTGYGGEITVRVAVESGEIAGVDIVEAEGETFSFLTKARKVIDDVKENNTWEVDTVTGATYSSRGILEAVQNALTGAASGGREITSQGALQKADGRYVGTAQGYGGEIKVRVTVENGYIVGVDILEAEKETDSFLNKARKVLADVTTANSYRVDTVTGATYSSRGILNAIQNALEGTAASPTPVPNPSGKTYLDGVYYGEGEGFGGVIRVRVTIDEGQIFALDIVEAEEETLSFFNRARAILDSILTAQSAEVDTVSGATYSSGGIREAVAQALAQAEPAQPTPEPTASPTPTPTPATPESAATPTPAPTGSAVPAYADGSYAGTAPCTRDGVFDYDVQVTFLVTDGVIGEITVEKGEDRSDEPDDNDSYLQRAIDGKGDTAGVPAQIEANQSADSIDAVSRATYSSKAIQAAVQNALAAGPQQTEDSAA